MSVQLAGRRALLCAAVERQAGEQPSHPRLALALEGGAPLDLPKGALALPSRPLVVDEVRLQERLREPSRKGLGEARAADELRVGREEPDDGEENVYYVAATESALATCRSCGSTLGTTLGVVAAVAVAAPVLYFGVQRGWTALTVARPAVAERTTYIWAVFAPHVKLKVAAGLEHTQPRWRVCQPHPHTFDFSLLRS